jgi:hypothetical protein
MMTRSKTAANAANANKAIAKAETVANEPKEAEVESNMNDKTVVYPSMFDRWREHL